MQKKVKDKPKISVILPLYNGEKFIAECLDSIAKQTFKDYELIIIDDGSKDETTKMLDTMGHSYHKNKLNLGFTRTVNNGIKMAKGDYILLADQDMTYEKDFLKKLIDCGKDIATCRMYYYKQMDKLRSLGLKISLLTGKTNVFGRDQIDTGQTVRAKDIMAVGAAMMLVKKEVFDNVGLFDECFRIYFTDVDWCLRAKRKGYSFYPTGAKTWHKKEEKEVLNNAQMENYMHDKERFFKKNSGFYPLPMILMRLKRAFLQISN